MNSAIDELKKSINKRIGNFLYTERKLARKTRSAVANKLQLEELAIARWESGLASPPAFIYMSILRYYGQETLQRAETLDFLIQTECHQKRRIFHKRNN